MEISSQDELPIQELLEVLLDRPPILCLISFLQFSQLFPVDCFTQKHLI